MGWSVLDLVFLALALGVVPWIFPVTELVSFYLWHCRPGSVMDDATNGFHGMCPSRSKFIEKVSLSSKIFCKGGVSISQLPR